MPSAFEVWIVRQNSDLTEGRGIVQERSYWKDEASAKKALDKTSGVMGSQSGKDIIKRTFMSNSYETDYKVKDDLVWGYHRLPDGQWRYGWTDERDLPENDPEWKDYLRLAEKFKDHVK